MQRAMIRVFFFSSRRRHTRSLCDWSSDVCSSDLFDYWREWLRRADRGDFNEEYPAPDEHDRRVSDWKQHLPGTWDIRQYNNNLLEKTRVILSRKRTRNFLDVSNTWKRTVLETLEDQTISDFNQQVQVAAQYAATKRPIASDDINTTLTGPAPKKRRDAPSEANPLEDGELEVEHLPRRGLAPTPSDQWSSRAMGSCGRGRLGL